MSAPDMNISYDFSNNYSRRLGEVRGEEVNYVK
jgi:hypothetical protein